MKMQYGGTEEEIRQIKEQEKLLKQAEEKFKLLDSDVKGPILTGLGSLIIQRRTTFPDSGNCSKMNFEIGITNDTLSS
jgi:hypothetical protein